MGKTKQGSDNSRKPLFRKLRGYAFDPSLSLQMDTASINDLVYKIEWEELSPGPCGEYIEVIDYDPTVKELYQPVNLNSTFALAQDGLDPSESNPLFHQQMVYAVTMTTIRNFEKALGRKIIWSPRRLKDSKHYQEYVRRLRIYPHAMRDANAFYSPVKKALLFGYFSSSPADETLHMPDSLVFTCLSHDIIAHETTHAILDGMHSYYNDPTNPDVLAFHEAFADIVALFQHFTFPEVLKHQIAKTRGDLASQNLLGKLAQEFGTAIGEYGSLRDAIGEIDPETKKWKAKIPDPNDYRTIMEPHGRGSILVAAVFEAFLNIYKCRVVDLLRIASNGSGILPLGDLHPDLVSRLAGEASKAAGHVLNMCIRALDYCPPVDITFGDYLRAIITADADLVTDDTKDYRLAFIDAFRKRGIYPENIKTLSVESLRHPSLDIGYAMDAKQRVIAENKNGNASGFNEETNQLLGIINGFLREYAGAVKYVNSREEIFDLTRDYVGGRYYTTEEKNNFLQLNPNKELPKDILGLHRRLNIKFGRSADFTRLTGLVFNYNFMDLGIRRSTRYNGPTFQIQNLRVVSRVGPNNNQINQVIFSIIQQSTVKCTEDGFSYYRWENVPKNISGSFETPEGYFEFRGGCTLIFDLDTLQLKYAVSKPLLDMNTPEGNMDCVNLKRLQSQSDYRNDENGTGTNEYAAYFSGGPGKINEPFCFLHQH